MIYCPRNFEWLLKCLVIERIYAIEDADRVFAMNAYNREHNFIAWANDIDLNRTDWLLNA